MFELIKINISYAALRPLSPAADMPISSKAPSSMPNPGHLLARQVKHG
jgi:hypothetical protein